VTATEEKKSAMDDSSGGKEDDREKWQTHKRYVHYFAEARV